MFDSVDLVYFFGPAMLVGIFLAVVLSLRTRRKQTNEVLRSIAIFKINLIIFGALLMILYLSLPVTPSLSTFGYPEDLSVIQDDKKLLHLLQTYNKALVRTTEVVHWFLFIFIWFFISILINFSTSIGKKNNNLI